MVIALMLSFITSSADVFSTFLLSRFIDRLGGSQYALSLLVAYGCVLIGSKFLDTCHGFFVSWYSAKAIECLRFKAHQWVLKRRKYGKLPFDSGGMVSRMMSDVDAVTRILTSPLNGLVPQIFTGIGALAMLAAINWRIAVLVVTALPVFYYATKRANVKSKSNAQASREIRSSFTSYFMDFANNYRVYVCYDGRGEEEKRSLDFGKNLTKMTLKQDRNLAAYFLFTTALNCGVVVASLFILYRSVIAGTVGAGAVLMVVNYVRNVLSPVLELSRYANQVVQANVALQRVFELEPDEDSYVGEFTEKAVGHISELSVENLEISYNGARKNAVDKLNFSISSPGLVCLYGPSGSGKSTVLHALCGLQPIQNGCIKVNGKDYSDGMLNLVLQRKVRMVFQDSMLFNRSLKENLTYGADGDLMTEEYMEWLTEGLGLEDLLADPKRNAQNGLNGAAVSGGEKRRVALARGLNQRADVYLFDEPTSELDQESACRVARMIEKLKEKSIVVISTHDPVFEDQADTILRF